jgi:hypothetical protein
MHGAVSPLPHVPHGMGRDHFTFLPSLSGSCVAFGEGKHSTVLLSFYNLGNDGLSVCESFGCGFFKQNDSPLEILLFCIERYLPLLL